MQAVLDLGIKMFHGLTWTIDLFIFLTLLRDISQRGVNTQLWDILPASEGGSSCLEDPFENHGAWLGGEYSSTAIA